MLSLSLAACFRLWKAIINDTKNVKCIKASELWECQIHLSFGAVGMSNTLELLSCENVKYIGASELWECQIHWSFGAVRTSNTLELQSCENVKYIWASELWEYQIHLSFGAVRMLNTLELQSCENVKYVGASELWECQIHWSFGAVRLSNTLELRSCENLAAKGVLSRSRGNWESQNYIWLWTKIWGELYFQKFGKIAKYCRSFWANIIFQQQTKWWILVGCNVTMHGAI